MVFVSSCVAIAGMWATQQMKQVILVSISYPACIELEKTSETSVSYSGKQPLEFAARV